MTKMWCLRNAFILCVGALPAIAAAQSNLNSASGGSVPLQEVTVTAHKLIDERTLEQVVIPRFVKSHGTASPYSHQLGRWTSTGVICPNTAGLKPAAAEFVSRRILGVATSIGAPTALYGHCAPNVEIIFTPKPQDLVSYFARTNRKLLAYDGKSLKDLVAFIHPIRAWYTTATQSFYGGWSVDQDIPNLQAYNWNFQGPGGASRLSVGLISGFVNVLVIVDSRQASEHSLGSIADYVAMLVLTRTSVDGCNELPSIIDLLSADCAGRAPPDSITAADIAYLKALYSSNLKMNANLEQGEMRDRMLKSIEGP